MSDPARVRRYAERIKELVAFALRKQVKDPRLGMVTITDARLTADLRDATLYYTVLGDPAEQAATSDALASANGLLRSIVGKRLGLRAAPTLTFVTDEVPQQATHIEELLAAARAADAEVQRRAAVADYAGDAQPYKVDDEDSDESDEASDEDAGVGSGGGATGGRA